LGGVVVVFGWGWVGGLVWGPHPPTPNPPTPNPQSPIPFF